MGDATFRNSTFVCFCHEALFCIFVPPRLPFPALHFSSQAPRRFSSLLETVTLSVDLSQTSSPPGVCSAISFNINPKSQTLLQFFLTTLFPPLLIPPPLSAYFSLSHYGANVFPSFITCAALSLSQSHEGV